MTYKIWIASWVGVDGRGGGSPMLESCRSIQQRRASQPSSLLYRASQDQDMISGESLVILMRKP